MPPDRQQCPDLDSMKTAFDPPAMSGRESASSCRFSGRRQLPGAVRQDREGVMVGLRSDTESMPSASNARSACRSVVAAGCASEDAGVHPSTYIAAAAACPVLTTPALVAHSDYCDYPGFPPSTPVIFPMFSSDFTDLAHLVNPLMVHVVTVI